MLKLNSIMVGSKNPKKLAGFYKDVFEKDADMEETEWFGWQFDGFYFNIGPHSEVDSKSKEPQRVIFNLETAEVKKEFERIKALGAEVVKEPYGLTATGEASESDDDMWIATFADPDGNYFQLVTPWRE